MFFVPAGPFPMGVDLEDDPAAFPHEDPRHDVVLASFWIDETEVTNRQYERCVKADECLPPQNTTAYDDRSRADHPVVHVDWSQADAYCRWLADKTGLDVRLPTEAQWEKAASWDPATQSKRRYPWGDEEPDPALFNYVASGLGHPVAVGSYPAASGPYGTLDTAGNVWEWIADWYDQNAYDASDGAVDPTGPDEGTRRVIRGGSFSFSEHEARTTHRDAMEPTVTRADIGFRCVVAGEWLPPGWQEKGE
jgi:formylglycine-generating enzyme required for sulfatase activity